ncbi:putative serine/threonine protein kinase [Arachis hypogaea]|nr:putative serine/threonine protein kinase [Arachis hypogaea]
MLSHKAVHLIQGINEQKARFIVSFVAAMPSGSLATTRKVSTWPPFSQRIKQTVMLHFYSANLMRDASLNDRVELRILGDVGAKILVINFDTPGVQLTNLAMVASSYSLHLGRDGERMRVAEAGETVLVGLPPFNAEHPQTIFDNILNRKIPWPAVPEEMSPEAQDLIDRLLTEDPNQRLGARGASEVI